MSVRVPPLPTVSELMTTNVDCCRPSDSLDTPARIMWDRACGCVPIIDHDRRPLSMITDRDVCMAAYIQGKALSEITVASAMSKRLLVIRRTDTLSTASAVMRRHGVRRLLVVDDDERLVGLLSIDDITRQADLGPLAPCAPLSPPAIAETVSGLSHSHMSRR